eukprot:TRINITY_DN2848_c1_g1_i1.p1 TRINITY_DN2848_c1_g1~~TRINITY_DN2848_c1_g1_i1.p1  ORF type:complete len:1314 (+),score=241.86 TRINITY_DN2848_c1_g1_i1:354-3944(+)
MIAAPTRVGRHDSALIVESSPEDESKHEEMEERATDIEKEVASTYRAVGGDASEAGFVAERDMQTEETSENERGYGQKSDSMVLDARQDASEVCRINGAQAADEDRCRFEKEEIVAGGTLGDPWQSDDMKKRRIEAQPCGMVGAQVGDWMQRQQAVVAGTVSREDPERKANNTTTGVLARRVLGPPQVVTAANIAYVPTRRTEGNSDVPHGRAEASEDTNAPPHEGEKRARPTVAAKSHEDREAGGVIVKSDAKRRRSATTVVVDSSPSPVRFKYVVEVGEVVSIAEGRVEVRYEKDGFTEWIRSSDIEEVLESNSESALATLEATVRRARVAIDNEAKFWHHLDQVALLPCAQLLAAGRAEAAALAGQAAARRAALDRHTALNDELLDEEEALSPEPAKRAVEELAKAAETHLDASDAHQDAAQAVQRARVRGRPLAPLEERAAEAKLAAKRADEDVRGAMLGLAEAMRRFPEVGSDPVVLKHLRVSLPQDLMPLWCVGRTLAHFDNRELLPGASRHRLFRATERDRVYAVKEYAVAGGHEGLRVCLHEAAILKRARHPHIVEICAIFADPDEHGFFIQMPFYELGSLDKWVRDSKPDDRSVCRVLAQVVSALAHLHGLGITHADVKPGNIILDRRGLPRLGDFDISVDSCRRTSAARANATLTQVGFTPGFAAPELLHTGASPATDIFALGSTIAEVTQRTPERDALLQRLQAVDPFARPSAQQVLQDPFFAPVFAWARDERRTCCICLDDGIQLEEGLECGRNDGEPHFVCSGCLEQHVEAACSMELRVRTAAEGRVRCPGRPCDAVAFTDVDLAKRLGAEVFRRYTESRLDLLEQRKAAELEEQMQARLDAELRRLQALDESQRRTRSVRNHIVEEILTLKCPRCGQAFLDFVGCFALQCSRCPCGFCAWCGADSGGNNAHEHVRNCREKPMGADVFFGSFEQFEAAQRRRRRRLLQRFLPTLDAQTRRSVLAEMRRDLQDLGLADLAGPAGAGGAGIGGPAAGVAAAAEGVGGGAAVGAPVAAHAGHGGHGGHGGHRDHVGHGGGRCGHAANGGHAGHAAHGGHAGGVHGGAGGVGGGGGPGGGGGVGVGMGVGPGALNVGAYVGGFVGQMPHIGGPMGGGHLGGHHMVGPHMGPHMGGHMAHIGAGHNIPHNMAHNIGGAHNIGAPHNMGGAHNIAAHPAGHLGGGFVMG